MLITCPHCLKTNRVPAERLADQPKCGACRQNLFTGKPVELDFAGLQRHIQNSELPLLVDFWAPWCQPCLMMAPAFSEAAAQLEPRMRLAKVNTEADQQAGAAYGIRNIPTMILFQNGLEVKRTSGAMGAQDIMRWALQ